MSYLGVHGASSSDFLCIRFKFLLTKLISLQKLLVASIDIFCGDPVEIFFPAQEVSPI